MYVCLYCLALDSSLYQLYNLTSLLVESEVQRTVAANTSLAVDRFQKQYLPSTMQCCRYNSTTVSHSAGNVVFLIWFFQ